MSAEGPVFVAKETYIRDGENPAYDLALLALARQGYNLDSSFRPATEDETSIRYGNFYLYTNGTPQSQVTFEMLQQTPEFGVVRNLFTRTEHAYLPGDVYRQEHGYEDRPVTFYRHLATSSWDDFLKSRVISRYWENEAENWRYSAQVTMGVAKAAFLTEALGAFEEEKYNLGQKIGFGCLASLISPYGLMGLVAGLYGKHEYSQHADACLAVARSVRKPFDRLTNEEIPELLVPTINRISLQS